MPELTFMIALLPGLGLIGSDPIGSYTNGSGLGLVWSGLTSEESNLIGSYRIPDQTRPDKVRSRQRSDQHYQ